MPTVYVTAPHDAAETLAREIVERRLAACVNRVDCTSTYRWDGEVVTEPETILLAKTTAAGYDDLVTFIERRHPYDVPCIERFDEAQVTPAFAAWIRDSVAGDPA